MFTSYAKKVIGSTDFHVNRINQHFIARDYTIKYEGHSFVETMTKHDLSIIIDDNSVLMTPLPLNKNESRKLLDDLINADNLVKQAIANRMAIFYKCAKQFPQVDTEIQEKMMTVMISLDDVKEFF